jgi:hypothetical protein
MLFKGVATAMVTPIHNDKIDYDKLSELIDRQLEAGVDAIVICGTTGESPTIFDDEKKELFEKSVQITAGRVPLIAGTGTNNTAHIIRFCEYAQTAGADGFLINNPYYNKSSDEGIIANYEAISNTVDRPIIVYNVPSRTGKNISANLAMAVQDQACRRFQGSERRHFADCGNHCEKAGSRGRLFRQRRPNAAHPCARRHGRDLHEFPISRPSFAAKSSTDSLRATLKARAKNSSSCSACSRRCSATAIRFRSRPQ